MTNLLYLLIEFIDELVFGVTDAAWPLMRTDLGLTYAQIGLALSLPGFISNFIEPFLFILECLAETYTHIARRSLFHNIPNIDRIKSKLYPPALFIHPFQPLIRVVR
jgi:hypothetical protein